MTYVPLFQEKLKAKPFWMLVGCVLVNRAQWTVAAPIHAGLMKSTLGTPAGLLMIPEGELVAELRPLGFQVSRARHLRNLAACFRDEPPLTVGEVRGIVGCGDYAADSWAIFIGGKRNLRPKDKRLKEFLVEERRRRLARDRELESDERRTERRWSYAGRE